MVSEIFHDVCIKTEYAKLVDAYDARDQQHDKNFMVEGKTLVVAMEHIKQPFRKRLRIVKNLESWKVGCWRKLLFGKRNEPRGPYNQSWMNAHLFARLRLAPNLFLTSADLLSDRPVTFVVAVAFLFVIP